MFGFYIEEKNIPMDIQKERNKLTSIRVGKISHIFTKKVPSILPFKGKFPLISENSIDNYINLYSEESEFENVPRFLKNIVYKAEQIVYYTNQFKDFLSIRDINEREFEAKNPTEKLKLLEKFLDEIQAEKTILEIKDYE